MNAAITLSPELLRFSDQGYRLYEIVQTLASQT